MVGRKNKNSVTTKKMKFNPLLPIAHKSARIGKILIPKLKGIIKKFSYERRDYESVDKKTYLWLCLEKLQKKNSGTKGSKKMKIYKFL